MLPIKPHIWFSHPVKQVAEFYNSLLPNSEISYANHFSMPDGQCDIVEFTIAGQPFWGISSGVGLEVNPSISFMLNFDPRDPDAVTLMRKYGLNLPTKAK